MKKLILLIFILIGTTLSAQTTQYTDDNGDGVIEYCLFADNGKKIEEGYYYNGQMYGTWRSYHKNGNLQTIAKFKDGVKHGKWLFYNENGNLIFEVTYERGQKILATEHRYLN